MTLFAAALIISIVLIVWFSFTLYDRLIFRSTWKQAAMNASAIALVVCGFLLAISEWG